MTVPIEPAVSSGHAAPKPRPAARTLRRILTAIVLLVGVWLAWRFWFVAESPDKLYLIEPAQKADIEQTVTATGLLQPRDYVDVGTQVSGQLKKIHVDIGTQVETGDLLAEIDSTVYRSRVDASRAQLANLQAQLTERRARLTLAEQQHLRQRGLMREEATTVEQLQIAEAEVHITRAQITALEAQIEQVESTLRGDEANLGYTKIYAPMSGTVVSLTARQGQTLNANQQAPIILRIADLSVMTVQAQVSEADVARLLPGMDAYFTTLGNPDRRWYGTLGRILPTPQILNNVILYEALFDVPNPNRELMTSMTAQVFFVVASAKDAVVVPITALLPQKPDVARGERRTSASVQAGETRATQTPKPSTSTSPASPGTSTRALIDVIDKDGAVERREVRTGVANRVRVQIVAGLAVGEQVVVGQRRAGAATPGSVRPNPSRPMGL